MLKIYFRVNKYILAEHETFNWQNNTNAENSTRYFVASINIQSSDEYTSDDRVLRKSSFIP